MTAIQCIVLITAGYLFGVYSMGLALRQQLRQAEGLREEAAHDLRRAGRLYGLTMRALGKGRSDGGEDDESEADGESV